MHRVAQVKPLNDYRLELVFNDGVRGIVDVSDIIGKGVFAKLNDRVAFEKVFVEGGAVTWEGGLDICPDTLYSEITGKPLSEVAKGNA